MAERAKELIEKALRLALLIAPQRLSERNESCETRFKVLWRHREALLKRAIATRANRWHRFSSNLPLMAFLQKKKKHRPPVSGPLRRLPGESVRKELDRIFENEVAGYVYYAVAIWALVFWEFARRWLPGASILASDRHRESRVSLLRIPPVSIAAGHQESHAGGQSRTACERFAPTATSP